MMSNSLSTVDIVDQQTGAGILSWNIWRQPVGFAIFWICALAECERLPFDLPEAEEELVAGYQTEYSGMKFALFYLGSYINLVLSALLVSVLYLGGWGFPLPVEWIVNLTGQSIDAPLVQVITATTGIVMTVLKAYLLVFFAILLRWTAAPGAHRPAAGSGLEVPAADRPGESAGDRRPQARLPGLLRRLTHPLSLVAGPSWCRRFPCPPCSPVMFGFLKKVGDYTRDAVGAANYLTQGLSVTFDHLRGARSRCSTPTRS